MQTRHLSPDSGRRGEIPGIGRRDGMIERDVGLHLSPNTGRRGEIPGIGRRVGMVKWDVSLHLSPDSGRRREILDSRLVFAGRR